MPPRSTPPSGPAGSSSPADPSSQDDGGRPAIPSPLRHLGKVILFVTDMARAVAFYRDVLGLAVRIDSPDWVELDTGAVTLALHAGVTPRPAGGPATDAVPHAQVSFAVASVAAAHAFLVARGVTFVHGPRPIAPGIALAHFQDPDGHALAVAGPA